MTRVLVDAGNWVRHGQMLAVIDRSVQASRRRSSPPRSRPPAPMPRWPRPISTARWRSRTAASCPRPKSTKRRPATRQAQVRVAQAQLGATRAQIGQLDIRADRGLVLARSVEVGQIVGPGSGALFRLAEGGEMEMRAEMSQQDLARVRTGMRRRSSRRLGPAFAGTVWQVSPVIDPQSRQGRSASPSPMTDGPPRRLRRGADHGRLDDRAAAAAKRGAERYAGNYVYIVGKDNKVERRDVKTARSSDTGVTVIDGLTGRSGGDNRRAVPQPRPEGAAEEGRAKTQATLAAPPRPTHKGSDMNFRNISSWCIRNPVPPIVLFVGLLLAGVSRSCGWT